MQPAKVSNGALSLLFGVIQVDVVVESKDSVAGRVEKGLKEGLLEDVRGSAIANGEGDGREGREGGEEELRDEVRLLRFDSVEDILVVFEDALGTVAGISILVPGNDKVLVFSVDSEKLHEVYSILLNRRPRDESNASEVGEAYFSTQLDQVSIDLFGTHSDLHKKRLDLFQLERGDGHRSVDSKLLDPRTASLPFLISHEESSVRSEEELPVLG